MIFERQAGGTVAAASFLNFFSFRLDEKNLCLWQGQERIKLTLKDFSVLHYLVTHAEQIISHRELLAEVWAGVVVSSGVPKVCIRRLRQALNDSAKPNESKFIVTHPRQGYRFIAPVSVTPPDSGERETETSTIDKETSVLPPPDVLVVGRETALTQLHGWFAKALTGKRHLVFVTGEPGIGKTSVVEAFRRDPRVAEQAAIGRGQCVEHYGPGEAYRPVLEALGRLCRGPRGEQLIRWMTHHAPTWLSQMPPFVGTADPDTLKHKLQGATREQMLREMVEGIEILSVDRPFVLLLEDLQWSDPSTLDLIATLARREESARFLLLGTYRPADMLDVAHPLQRILKEMQPHRLYHEIALSLLSEHNIADYLDSRFPHHALPERLASLLHERTGGNPLFLTNVLADWLAKGTLIEDHHRWIVRGDIEALVKEIPESVRQFIAKQSQRLLLLEQRVLEAASLAGAEFSSATVAAALESDVMEIEEWCAGLADRQLFLQRSGVTLWPDGTEAECYRFSHALYRQLWHERVGTTRRQRLHQRIGERQEAAYRDRTREIAVELAEHFEKGRDYQRAARYRHHAAEQAIQRYAQQEAVLHLTKSLDLLALLPDTPERVQQKIALHTTLGITLQAIRGYSNSEVEETYLNAQSLAQNAQEPSQLFRVLFGLWQFRQVRAEYRTALELGNQLFDLAQSAQDSGLLVEAHGALGHTLFHLGEFLAAQVHKEQGMAAYDREQHQSHAITYGQDPWVAIRTYSGQGLWLLGYPDQALQRITEAWQYAQELGHPFSQAFALHDVALIYQFHGNLSEVQRHAEDLLALAHEHNFPFWELGAKSMLGWVLAQQGQGEHVLARVRQGAVRQEMGAALRVPYYQARLAEIYAIVGRPQEGLALLDKALAVVESTGERWWEAEIYRLKGELLLQSVPRSASQAGR
ncbi:MAG: AAA family ATPase [Deltaproteobacteria bacterium]|nr:AAA family ATPase [Deltaproteobacteria bacterium]